MFISYPIPEGTLKLTCSIQQSVWQYGCWVGARYKDLARGGGAEKRGKHRRMWPLKNMQTTCFLPRKLGVHYVGHNLFIERGLHREGLWSGRTWHSMWLTAATGPFLRWKCQVSIAASAPLRTEIAARPRRDARLRAQRSTMLIFTFRKQKNEWNVAELAKETEVRDRSSNRNRWLGGVVQQGNSGG